jgi:hypothetical protein
MIRRRSGFWINVSDRWGTSKTHILHVLQVACLLLCAEASASTIVVIWTPDQVVIAADSMLSDLDGKPIGTACKIRSEGFAYFATAGLFEQQIRGGFYMPNIVHRAYVQSSKESDHLFWFLRWFNTYVSFDLDSVKDAASDAVALNPNLSNAEIVVVWKGTNGPCVYYSHTEILPTIGRRGTALPGGARGVPSMVSEYSIPTGAPWRAEMIVIGFNDHIARYQVEHPEWRSADPVLAAREFVQMEIDNHPTVVGAPIAVLTIGRDGTEKWIDKGDGKVCPARE